MLSRFSRLVLVQWQKCTPGSEIGGLRHELAPLHASFLNSMYVHSASPAWSHDPGPQRNYKKKMKKREKTAQSSRKTVNPDALLDAMKQLERQQAATPASTKKDSATLTDLLSDMKVYVPSNAEVRKRLGMPEKPPGILQRNQKMPELKGRDKRKPVHFMDPTAGPRLGIFDHPRLGVKEMPPHKPTLAEQDAARGLENLMKFTPDNHFESLMTETRFPRHFPIDNEDYESKEHSVGFEDHVLLDDLLEGFPKKGPVRHFMELVVTGLAKNPHYSATEKVEYVEWYKEYFSQFTLEELQALPITKKEQQ